MLITIFFSVLYVNAAGIFETLTQTQFDIMLQDKQPSSCYELNIPLNGMGERVGERVTVSRKYYSFVNKRCKNEQKSRLPLSAIYPFVRASRRFLSN